MKKYFLLLTLILVLNLSKANLVLALDLGGILHAVSDVAEVVQTFTMSDAREMAMGAEIHPSLLAQMGGRSPNQQVNQYVEQVGQKLARLSGRKNIKYHFTVVNADMINAFALPGGYIYITKGILAAMKDEAELAVVLGHEIGHVERKHGVKKMQEMVLAQKGANYTGQLGGALAKNLAVIFSQLAISGYGRSQELEADRVGVQLANQSSYDPYGAVRMFEMLLSQEKGRGRSIQNKFFASHPDTQKRIAQAKSQIAQLGSLGKTTNKTQYQNVMR